MSEKQKSKAKKVVYRKRHKSLVHLTENVRDYPIKQISLAYAHFFNVEYKARLRGATLWSASETGFGASVLRRIFYVSSRKSL